MLANPRRASISRIFPFFSIHHSPKMVPNTNIHPILYKLPIVWCSHSFRFSAKSPSEFTSWFLLFLPFPSNPHLAFLLCTEHLFGKKSESDYPREAFSDIMKGSQTAILGAKLLFCLKEKKIPIPSLGTGRFLKGWGKGIGRWLLEKWMRRKEIGLREVGKNEHQKLGKNMAALQWQISMGYTKMAISGPADISFMEINCQPTHRCSSRCWASGAHGEFWANPIFCSAQIPTVGTNSSLLLHIVSATSIFLFGILLVGILVLLICLWRMIKKAGTGVRFCSQCWRDQELAGVRRPFAAAVRTLGEAQTRY